MNPTSGHNGDPNHTKLYTFDLLTTRQIQLKHTIQSGWQFCEHHGTNFLNLNIILLFPNSFLFSVYSWSHTCTSMV